MFKISALFWDITQPIVAIPYQCCRTTYRGPIRRQGISTVRWVIYQKSADLTYIAGEA